MPRVSIGMPVYNGEKYLVDALESVLTQTFTDFELIIVDNASSDHTQDICLAYAKIDPRIQYHRNESNLGAAANYNKAFALSSGEYFKWMPHDDRMAPENLARCVEVLDREPSVVLCYPKTMNIDERGNEIGPYNDRLHLLSPKPQERLGQLVTRCGDCNAVLGLIRSESMRKTHLIDKYRGSDFTFLVELCLLGKFWEVPEYLFLRRKHPDRVIQTTTPLVEIARWFDPDYRGKGKHYQIQLFRKQLSIIRDSGLSWTKRQICYLQVGRWVLLKWRVIGGRHKASLLRKLGFNSHAS